MTVEPSAALAGCLALLFTGLRRGGRSGRLLSCQKLERRLECHNLGVRALRQGHVGALVLDVGAVAPFPDLDRSLIGGMFSELLQDDRRLLEAFLGYQCHRPVEADRKHIVIREVDVLSAVLQVGAETSDTRQDGFSGFGDELRPHGAGQEGQAPFRA